MIEGFAFHFARNNHSGTDWLWLINVEVNYPCQSRFDKKIKYLERGLIEDYCSEILYLSDSATLKAVRGNWQTLIF